MPLLPDPLRLGVRVPVRVPSIGQMQLLDHLTMCKQMTDIELSVLNSNI